MKLELHLNPVPRGISRAMRISRAMQRDITRERSVILLLPRTLQFSNFNKAPLADLYCASSKICGASNNGFNTTVLKYSDGQVRSTDAILTGCRIVDHVIRYHGSRDVF